MGQDQDWTFHLAFGKDISGKTEIIDTVRVTGIETCVGKGRRRGERFGELKFQLMLGVPKM